MPIFSSLPLKYDLPTLLPMYDEAAKAVEKPEALSPKVLAQCREIVDRYAAAIRTVAKKLQLLDAHPAKQALKHLVAPQQQHSEMWPRYSKVMHNASEDTENELKHQWCIIVAQVKNTKSPIIRASLLLMPI